MTRDLIIVVPGFMGSVLKRGNVPVWDRSVPTMMRTLRDFAAAAEALRLPEGLGDAEPSGPAALKATGLVNGWHIWPGVWAGAGYHHLLTTLQTWYPEPYQVQTFPYDWRLSNRISAQRLKQFVEPALDRWRTLTRNNNAQVIFVCHSMGGLVTRFYVNRLDGHQTCRRIITIGTPYTGSIKAIRALTGDLPLVPDSLVDVSRSFPALHQLLPSFRCVRQGSETVALTDTPVPGIPDWMAHDAKHLHTETVGHPTSPPIHTYAGHLQSTSATIRVVGSELKYQETWPEPGQNGPIERNYGGDATVPRFAATPPEFADDTGTEFHGDRHSALPNRRRLLRSVHRKIENLAPASFLDPGFEFGVDLPDIAQSNTPVPIKVHTPAPDLDFRVTISNLQGTPLIKAAALTPDDAGYGTTLDLPPGIWQATVSATGQDPDMSVSDVIWVA